jgi:4-hydroxy-2-oxoheptanedioate aldolase
MPIYQPSEFRKALNTGTPQLGMNLMYPSPGVVERIGGDWDWIWIDGQHGQHSYDSMLASVRACQLVGRASFPRVPSHEAGAIGLVLDMGATGVIVPVVSTVEEAKAVVRAAKFPPLGQRSYGGRRPIDLWGRGYSDTANEDTILIVQIESPEAVENAERIAAIPGIDGLFLGPDDVLLRRGHSPLVPRTKEILGNDLEAVVKACRNNGKIPVCVGMGPEQLRLCVDTGCQMIVAGGDVPFLANTSKSTSQEARQLLKGKIDSQTPKGGATSSFIY